MNTQILKKDILNHANQCHPQESCGFVVADHMDGIPFYLPCKNIADDPIHYFEISADDFLKTEELGEIIALVHSHPDSESEKGLPYLSTADRECQVRTGLDFWLVVNGEIKPFRNIPPLLGRTFENNKQDCRNIILDSYMLSGLALPDDSVYDFNWFEHANLYEEGMRHCGFMEVEWDKPLQLGDVVLLQIGAKVANHAGIYLDNQMMLHHSQHRLSARVPYDGFWLKSTHSVWRVKQWQQLHFTAILNDLAMSQ